MKLSRDEIRIEVDLDKEQGRDNNTGKNSHKIFIKLTRQVDFSGLQAFLDRRAAYSNECIDCINFLDHLMREWPSQRYTQIKKSFFQRGEQRFDLGGAVEAFKGVFASLRPCLNDKYVKSLTVNVDVANGTFWRTQSLGRAVCQCFGWTPEQLGAKFELAQREWKTSYLKRDLRRFNRVGVTATHVTPPVQYTIDSFMEYDCTQATFLNKEGKTVSLRQYFKDHYGLMVKLGLPVVKVTKKIRGKPVYLPVDVLHIDANQRYNTKLSDHQTSNMIKFAVTLPTQRWAAVEEGVKLLSWPKDPYLEHYGLTISKEPAKVTGHLLPPPSLRFGGKTKDSTVSPRDLLQGRWRLDNRQFFAPNTKNPIKAWGVCVISGRGSPGPEPTEKFVQSFVKIYTSHGGAILSHPKFGTKPWIGQGLLSDGGELVNKAFTEAGNRYGCQPNLMFFVVNDRNVEVYRRIKKSMDVRFGVVSQVIQGKHVYTGTPQYISNVCMKVNAKLGGSTAVAHSLTMPKFHTREVPSTMVVGADVSHPAPGAGSGEAASFAAITMSSDPAFTRYWAEVQTNGHRVEMITTWNMLTHFGRMAKNWMIRLGNGQPPKRIIYIRDGVSEGQYAAVLNEEVRDMKIALQKMNVRLEQMPKFCVMIAGKRHHIRFFPLGGGDKNKNPLPGTLVESGCTHPHEFDFYLCSHVAIKGTARPIHYQCIMNEDGAWTGQEIQQFIFEHSYQYVRSTTPVSMHPAVYYAHLAADRSRSHVNESPVASGKKKEAPAQVPVPARPVTTVPGTKVPDTTVRSSANAKPIEVAPLMPMPNGHGIRETMWFI